MTWTQRWLMTLAVALCTGVAVAADPVAGAQESAHLQRSIAVELDYLIYLPEGYEEQESWPLLLFLHGSGERGDDLERVKVHGPPKLIAAGRSFPMIVVSPQCAAGKRWQPVELSALLDELEEQHRVDADRIYVTGLSMGGFGTWALASHEPGRFAAIAPICGGGETFWARDLAALPVWAFHGDQDAAVPVERTVQMIEALRARGAEPQVTIYPGVGHDSWTQTYDNPEFYEWLLQQRRKPAAAGE